MKQKLTSVILPTYNEAGNITVLVDQILDLGKKKKIPLEIIIVDDDSPDGTAKKARKKFQRSKNVKIFLRTTEKGLASAIAYGINNATGEFIVVMDTDFNHDPREIPVMLDQIKKYKLVIGSRFVKNGGMENKLRQWLSFLFNIYLESLLGHAVNDNLSGFFMIRKKHLLKLPIKTIFKGFGEYFIALIYEAYQRNYSIVEIPVFYKNRVHGQSKSKFLDMFIDYSLSGIRLKLGAVK